MGNNQRILDAARDFKIASDILKSKFGEPIFPLRSTIVTIAFSIELYLKYLATCSGLSLSGHNLHKIYLKLPKDLQSSIAASFSGTNTVEELLSKHSNLFIDWRYIYDKQDEKFSITDIPSLISFRDVLEGIASQFEKKSI